MKTIKFLVYSFLFTSLMHSGDVLAQQVSKATDNGTYIRRPVVMQDVKIGGFWHDHFKRLTCRWLPHCIREMEAGGRGEELLNLIATGEVLSGRKPSVAFKGCPWSDAYPYNTVEAICLVLEIDPGDDSVLKHTQDFCAINLNNGFLLSLQHSVHLVTFILIMILKVINIFQMKRIMSFMSWGILLRWELPIFA